MEQAEVKNKHSLLSPLEALKNACKSLQNNSFFITQNPQPAIEALLELHAQAGNIFSTYPNLSKLSQLLCSLKTLLQNHRTCQDYSLKSLLRRQITNYRIYQLAVAIEAEVQACIDRDCVQNLVRVSREIDSEEEKLRVLKEFEKRLSQGFDSDFQELVLKAKGFSILESLLCDSTCSKRIREQTGLCIVALVRFNRNVFVGLVLMSPIVQSLISTASACLLQVLCSLIRLIKTPLIDEIELDGEIPRILSLLSSEDLSIQAAALDCICEIAFSGRKEVIEAMIDQGLIEKLVELQRSIHGDNFVMSDQENWNENGSGVICEGSVELGAKRGCEEGQISRDRPFASCVARFAVPIEVGEGLNQRERKEFKREILRRVREASASEAEAASVVAEKILWNIED
ncbi:uncharacterized protein LOC110603874 isoform X1 [Manihot esculenta]|uniref:uncharacterized protein LOC110603874 isoform X1 n=1 Tax=Manihot esculenta TaxID=3983 RepID=UPI000B5D8262|nr:uncharacterized protein LOC110603874 isoform X1 [Manihot esculenta]